MTDWSPLWLSLRVAATALVVVAPLGTLLGYAQSRAQSRLALLLDALLLLPLVLPPSVTGYYLLVLFGRHGVFGSALQKFGVTIVFTFWGAALASAVVALPLMVKTAQAAFTGVDPDLEEVAYTLGLSRMRTFFAVTLPQARAGLLAATTLAFARAVGEFGATLLFAGNIPGKTNTAPLEIYASLQVGDDGRAAALTLGLTLISVVVVLVAGRFARVA